MEVAAGGGGLRQTGGGHGRARSPRRWFSALSVAERVVVGLTAVAVLAAVVFVVLPYSTDEGMACRAALVESFGGPAGPGAPAGLEPDVVEPCTEPARRRVLATLVWIVLAPVTGWVGLSVARERSREDRE
jgi:hypothetical protein